MSDPDYSTPSTVDTPAPLRRRIPILVGLGLSIILAIVVVAVTIAIRAGERPASTPAAAAVTISAQAPAPTIIETSAAPTTAELDCEVDGGSSSITIVQTSTGWDFTNAWNAKPTYCTSELVLGTSAFEYDALKVAKYPDGNIGSLLALCAEVDPEDVYLEKGFAMSPEQVAEVTGALMLCPNHPHASAWKAAMKSGQADAKLTKDGRLFGDGTYRVGSEIKPGTYVSKNVDGCYWERQDRNGQTIDNYFAESAKRVQVTIRKGDYGFHTENCGTWRPA